MKILHHRHIQEEVFKDLVKFFISIETILSLHYSNHTIDPSLNKILESSALLIGRRITIEDLLCILNIYPEAYSISHNNKTNDKSEFLISLPEDVSVVEFNQYIPQRKKRFVDGINLWIVNNKDASSIKHPSIDDIVQIKKAGSPSKVIKPQSISPSKTSRKNMLKELKNDPSKFTFKSKEENVEREKNNGLSLLERIKLKEKINKEKKLQESPEMKYEVYIRSKLISVYDILFHIHQSQNKPNASYPLTSLVSKIEDSLDYPSSKDEIIDIIRLIEKRLGTEKIQVLSRSGITAVKIIRFDRDNDIEVLK